MRSISFKKLSHLFPYDSLLCKTDDYFFADFRRSEAVQFKLNVPRVLNCITLMYCQQSQISFTCNGVPFKLRPGWLAISFPGDIITVQRQPGTAGEVRCLVFAMSTRLADEIEPDMALAKLFFTPRSLPLSAVERREMKDFTNIMGSVTLGNHRSVDSTLMMICKAMSLEVKGVWTNYQASTGDIPAIPISGDGPMPDSARRRLVSSFLFSVAKHCETHRNVDFYLDLLNVTQRQLSLAVREVADTTIDALINSAVILRAKHSLKFSHLSIKEIAATLNFINQAAFYKYFKLHAGLTPTEYRMQQAQG